MSRRKKYEKGRKYARNHRRHHHHHHPLPQQQNNKQQQRLSLRVPGSIKELSHALLFSVWWLCNVLLLRPASNLCIHLFSRFCVVPPYHLSLCCRFEVYDCLVHLCFSSSVRRRLAFSCFLTPYAWFLSAHVILSVFSPCIFARSSEGRRTRRGDIQIIVPRSGTHAAWTVMRNLSPRHVYCIYCQS